MPLPKKARKIMAIKIIRKPSKVFIIECQTCEALLEYSFSDIEPGIATGTIKCPCCGYWNNHTLRKRIPKESEGEG